MTTIFGPLLAAALLGQAQIQGALLTGKVTDDQGKPVSGAQVFFIAPPSLEGNADPAEGRTDTDAAGQFVLALPLLGRLGRFGTSSVQVWAYRPGFAITAKPSYLQPLDLVLRKPEPKVVKVEGPDGRAVSGAIVSPRILLADGSEVAPLPHSLERALAVTTGPDGTVALSYLQRRDQLGAVRITAESIGSQEFQLVERPGQLPQGATITIRLKGTTRLTGRVRTRAGEPVAGQVVEVWLKGATWLPSNPVVFRNGPLSTGPDGSFQTPDNLMVGSQYRVVVRAPGTEPILSNWITIEEKPRALLPFIQRPLRAISGRVIDRQGKPLADIDVFQAGDGPERTATKSGADGRFALAGFRQGPVFLFARGPGYRFFGRLIRPGDHDISVELTRENERPATEMRMLPEPEPPEESRFLARRLIEPYLEAAIKQTNPRAQNMAMRTLASADPAVALQMLETLEAPSPLLKPLIQSHAARLLARTDPARAQKAAEAIGDPRQRVATLVALAEAMRPEERDRKVELLASAAVHAKSVKSANYMAVVGERLYELGAKDKAKALLADALLLPKQMPRLRASLAARLACVDLPAALAIAREFPASGPDSAETVFRNIALRLAGDNPAEAERVMRLVPQEKGQPWLPSAIVWKMAAVDPARARRLADEAQQCDDHPQTYLFLALGLKARDPAAAEDAFQTAMRGIDRQMNERTELSANSRYRRVLLPLVEQIDPALVPELFWRAVASRPPIGNPRSLRDPYSTVLVTLLGWYDRDVAAALFEPVRDRMEQLDDVELAQAANEFVGWSIFDPRAAVARLEHVPISTNLELNNDHARDRVAELLALPYERRWHYIWVRYTEMSDILDRDIR